MYRFSEKDSKCGQGDRRVVGYGIVSVNRQRRVDPAYDHEERYIVFMKQAEGQCFSCL